MNNLTAENIKAREKYYTEYPRLLGDGRKLGEFIEYLKSGDAKIWLKACDWPDFIAGLERGLEHLVNRVKEMQEEMGIVE